MPFVEINVKNEIEKQKQNDFFTETRKNNTKK